LASQLKEDRVFENAALNFLENPCSRRIKNDLDQPIVVPIIVKCSARIKKGNDVDLQILDQ
jgi:hypothetical protein